MAVNAQEQADSRLNAERAVLGSMLIDESVVRDVLACVDAEDFLNQTNRLVYQAARKLFRDSEPVDAFTVRSQIGEQYTNYLMQLMEITPTSANWQVYADMMRQQAALQRVKDLAVKLDGAVTLEECRDTVARLGALMADGRRIDSWTTREMLDDFYAVQDPEAVAPDYITTGIEIIDSGSYIEAGDVLVIGGEPSSGKTAFALMMAYHMAKDRKVGFFSLETAKQKVRDRLVAHMAQVEFNAIKRRELSEKDWTSVAAKGADFAKRDLTVLRASGMTVTEIQATAQAYGLDVIVVDYVQLIVPEGAKNAIRSEQIAEMSRSLHTFAQKTGTLVVELAQIARVERGTWRELDMHDLKESGQLEADADMIFMLFRPNPKDADLDGDRHRILKIAKNKEHRQGAWPVYFDGAKQTFCTMVREDGQSRQTLRQLTSAGKAARNRNRIQGQQSIGGFREIRGADPEVERVFPQEVERH